MSRQTGGGQNSNTKICLGVKQQGTALALALAAAGPLSAAFGRKIKLKLNMGAATGIKVGFKHEGVPMRPFYMNGVKNYSS